jgi:hypothetical protein
MLLKTLLKAAHFFFLSENLPNSINNKSGA